MILAYTLFAFFMIPRPDLTPRWTHLHHVVLKKTFHLCSYTLLTPLQLLFLRLLLTQPYGVRHLAYCLTHGSPLMSVSCSFNSVVVHGSCLTHSRKYLVVVVLCIVAMSACTHGVYAVPISDIYTQEWYDTKTSLKLCCATPLSAQVAVSGDTSTELAFTQTVTAGTTLCTNPYTDIVSTSYVNYIRSSPRWNWVRNEQPSNMRRTLFPGGNVCE
jgi:hypothetical protein